MVKFKIPNQSIIYFYYENWGLGHLQRSVSQLPLLLQNLYCQTGLWGYISGSSVEITIFCGIFDENRRAADVKLCHFRFLLCLRPHLKSLFNWMISWRQETCTQHESPCVFCLVMIYVD